MDRGRADELDVVERPLSREHQERRGLRAAEPAVAADELLERRDLGE